MCGIVGILSNENNIFDILLNGLKNLQNRGYDSAGICSIQNHQFIIDKSASTSISTAIHKIEKQKSNHLHSNIGIAHTRWATHGAKTDANSHPHASSDGKFMIVHNGIIENFNTLKHQLIKNDYTFNSETDSEVIANLLAYHYSLSRNVIKAIKNTIQQMVGTWGLCVLCIDYPNNMYCVRNGSPLLVGQNQNMVMVVSEQSGFNEEITDYIVLNNNDICVIQNEDNNITITTNHSYNLKTIQNHQQVYSCEPYPYWTIKEIYEQTNTILQSISFGGRVLSSNEVKLGGLDTNIHLLKDIENIIILGCGTSYHAGLLGRHYFKELSAFNSVQVFDGAEFELQDVPKLGKTALILLSQSGETKDLHRCIHMAKTVGLTTIGVVNVVDSLIAREVDCGCYLNAGREVGVASTKSFTSQCIVLSLIAIWFSQIHNIHFQKREKYITNLLQLGNQVSELLNGLEEKINDLIHIFDDQASCFVLGKGQSEAIAREGSLKIKEISYIHSEAYSTSSLKHGPFALLEPKFPVVLLMPMDEHIDKNMNAFHEISSRNANIIVIRNKPNLYSNKEVEFLNTIYVPHNEKYNGVLNAIPLQMLAYKLSLHRGINPDMPKNLAKVVTVE